MLLLFLSTRIYWLVRYDGGKNNEGERPQRNENNNGPNDPNETNTPKPIIQSHQVLGNGTVFVCCLGSFLI